MDEHSESEFWRCECGQKEPILAGEGRKEVGNAIFRAGGCTNCRRPIQLWPPAPPKEREQEALAA
jgi:hypothetical protein